jgi:hypothetical protein
MEVLPLIHKPAPSGSLSVIVEPAQTVAGPVIADGTGFTLIRAVAAEPQPVL